MGDPVKGASESVDSIGFSFEFLMENRDLGLESDFSELHDGFGLGVGAYYRFDEAPFHLGLLFKYSKLEAEIEFEDYPSEISELEIMSIGVTGEYPIELGAGFILPLGLSLSLVHYGSEGLYFDLHQNPWDEIDAWGGQIAGHVGLGYRLESIPLMFSVLGSITGDFGLEFVQSVVGNPDVDEYRSEQSPLGFGLNFRVSYEPIEIDSVSDDEVLDEMEAHRDNLRDLADQAQKLYVSMVPVMEELNQLASVDIINDKQKRDRYISLDHQYEDAKILLEDVFQKAVREFSDMKSLNGTLSGEAEEVGTSLLNQGSGYGHNIKHYHDLLKKGQATEEPQARTVEQKVEQIKQDHALIEQSLIVLTEQHFLAEEIIPFSNRYWTLTNLYLMPLEEWTPEMFEALDQAEDLYAESIQFFELYPKVVAQRLAQLEETYLELPADKQEELNVLIEQVKDAQKEILALKKDFEERVQYWFEWYLAQTMIKLMV